MSEYYTQIVRIEKLEPHPNADTLSIAHVLGGYPVIVKTGEFREGDLASYLSVDTLVPTKHPSFAFLAPRAKGRTHYRVRAMKLRGVFSMGLLVPAPKGVQEGDDIAKMWGIEKYVPPREANHNMSRASSRSAFEGKVWFVAAWVNILNAVVLFLTDTQYHVWNSVTALLTVAIALAAIKLNSWLNKKPDIPIYDIEGLRRYPDVFVDGEPVYITEKIHGTSASFLHTGRRFHSKSRTVFRPRIATDTWWKIAEQYDLEAKLKTCPGMVLFGEIYGHGVQDLEYGCKPGEIRFAAFDVMNLKTRKYLSVNDFIRFCNDLDIPRVPILYTGTYSREAVERYAEMNSVVVGAKHVAEGVVVKPWTEQHVPGLGRKFLKYVGEKYLTRSEAA